MYDEFVRLTFHTTLDCFFAFFICTEITELWHKLSYSARWSKLYLVRDARLWPFLRSWNFRCWWSLTFLPRFWLWSNFCFWVRFCLRGTFWITVWHCSLNMIWTSWYKYFWIFRIWLRTRICFLDPFLDMNIFWLFFLSW